MKAGGHSPSYTEASCAAFQASLLLSAEKRIEKTKTSVALPSSFLGHDDCSAASVYSQEHPLQTRHHPDQSSSRKNAPPPSSRRSFLSLITFAAVTTAPLPISLQKNDNPSLPQPRASSAFVANAAETIGKDESCNNSSCLGVWDGLLADCPHGNNKLKGGGAGCVSSQDDTPGIFAEPWDYSENMPISSSLDVDNTYLDQMNQLILALQTTSKQHGDDVKIVYQEGRYLRASVTDGSSGEQSIAEFYFTPSDTTVQFRIGSTASTTSLVRSLSNKDRSERIRKSLSYLKLPVLRNRKRTFFFVESDDLDGFGPGSASLGPPEEMSPGDLAKASGVDGMAGRGSDEVDPKLRIDWLESFPIDGSR
ncbi:hypothetical protein ACHAXR_013360 [Thalassiosira sp. AJA248-18]